MQHRAALCAARSSKGPKLLGARRLCRRFASASENPPGAASSNAKVLEPVAAGFSRAAVAVAVAVACRIAFSCRSDRGAAALAAPTRDLASMLRFTRAHQVRTTIHNQRKSETSTHLMQSNPHVRFLRKMDQQQRTSPPFQQPHHPCSDICSSSRSRLRHVFILNSRFCSS